MAEFLPPLRVLISSSPKTGNTWLLNLLATLYDLPKFGVNLPSGEKPGYSPGDRWIAFHHENPRPEMLDWLRANRVILLTTIRHPGDVLISLYHHQHGFEHSTEDPAIMRAMLHVPFERQGIVPIRTGTFADELAISVEWLRAGSQIVRYEDLWRDPGGTLAGLTATLGPVVKEKIDRAVEKCDIELMRRLAGEHGGFFRSGNVGEWRERLTREIVQDLGKAPYRELFAELGYTLDPADPLIAQPAKPRPRLNPFRDSPAFENGAAAAPIIADCYLSHDLDKSRSWGPATGTGAGSYFEWLNAPCPVAGEGIYASLHISNLAHHAYVHRSDLQDAFPSLSSPDRLGFKRWFVSHGQAEYNLDPAFLDPMRSDLPAWVQARSSPTSNGTAWPRLSNLARHVRNQNPALFAAFPDLSGSDSARFAEWFVRNGASQLGIEPVDVEPVRAALAEWGNARSAEDPEDQPWWPPLSNFALYVYRMREDAQRCYPDVFGADRWHFLQWLIEHGNEMSLFSGCLDPLRMELESRLSENPFQGASLPAVVVDLYLACSPAFRRQFTNDSFLNWINGSVRLEGKAVYSALHLSNLAYYIYRTRPDLRAAFPDLSGPNRANYAEWFVRNGEREFGLGTAFLDPVRNSLLAWGRDRNPLDKMMLPWWPKLTNFAIHLYSSRPDVQTVYPDVLQGDRWNFLQWTVDNAAELNLYPPLAEPIVRELKRLRFIRTVGALVRPGPGTKPP